MPSIEISSTSSSSSTRSSGSTSGAVTAVFSMERRLLRPAGCVTSRTTGHLNPGGVMKTKAAILWEVGKDWSVEEIDLDPPKQGEVLVKLAASGMCHSDEHLVTGDLVMPPEIAEMLGLQQFPIIGGHE